MMRYFIVKGNTRGLETIPGYVFLIKLSFKCIHTLSDLRLYKNLSDLNGQIGVLDVTGISHSDPWMSPQ